MKLKVIILALTLLSATSCGTRRFVVPGAYEALSAEDRQLADTLILKTLDNEGLYTVMSRLKPMSSVTDLYLSVAQADTSLKGGRNVVDPASKDLLKLQQYQRVVNALQFGDLRFVLAPFKMNQKEKRVMYVNVFRASLVDSLVKANQPFYGQFGFVPGTRPEILINTTEYEHKYDRFRSYGYLFGYPEHAVSFFVDAAISDDRAGKFVTRGFFQIPVYSRKNGHFVYAIPKDYTPAAVDSTIYKRAESSLEVYKALRAKYMRTDSTVRAYDLLRQLLSNAGN